MKRSDRTFEYLADHEQIRLRAIGRHVVQVLESGEPLSLETLQAALGRTVKDPDADRIGRMAAENAAAWLSGIASDSKQDS